MMARKVLIVDNDFIDIISSCRATLPEGDQVVSMDKKMASVGLTWVASIQSYAYNHPPPTRVR